ncbi:hypothetical protein CK203_072537 [Vitis vinifera]|uniref:RING finger and transmembrane domain-containing protein 2 n=1 Tax=Vitis vinifera TaxID=29760 RepID=A0A438F9B7_VITVI|nr:hypothetical protein CK203_072537 [Vitis vinifera]
METSGSNSRYGIHIAASNFIQAPLAALLEYSGIFSTRSSSSQETDGLIAPSPASLDSFQSRSDDRDRDHDPSSPASTPEEVSIRIIGAGEQEREAVSLDNDRSSSEQISEAPAVSDTSRNESGKIRYSAICQMDRADSSIFFAFIGCFHQTTFARPNFVIVQDISGFFVTIWIAAVMFKSNDILRKQTALKGERKLSVLTGITAVFMLHVICVYWWYRNNDLLYPLVLLPPKAIPPFWHAIFIIMVNDTMVRQAAMALKCILLMYYKNSRGRDYRKQGQMLTLVEYLLLLYRALLPTPVWYRFFLNKEYGSLFSSLTTGLYLTFKLTSVVEKVCFSIDIQSCQFRLFMLLIT